MAGEDGPERAEAGQWRRRGWEAGTAARKSHSRQISLRIGGELGSASHPVNLKVEGGLLPHPTKFFTGPTRLRGLIGQLFSRGPKFDSYFASRSIIRGLLEML